MASAISSVTSTQPPQLTPVTTTTQTQQVQKDSDGDYDGTQPGQVDTKDLNKPKPVSPTIGNNINTTA